MASNISNIPMNCNMCSSQIGNNQKVLICSTCNLLFHPRCMSFGPADYLHACSDNMWLCKFCLAYNFPFSNLNDFEFAKILSYDRPTSLDFLPSFDVLSKLSSMPNLSDFDNENMMPNPVNSQYYYMDDLNTLKRSFDINTFSLFHINFRSLDAHFDELQSLLYTMDIPFHIIGISETRELINKGFKMNNNLRGYDLYTQPTKLSAGGVAMYISNSLIHNERSDLSCISNDFETLWIEIKNSKGKNILCSCIYRHPSSDPRKFREHIESIFLKISNENKQIFII